MSDDRYLYVKIVEAIHDKSIQDHVYDEDDNKLGILPMTKVTTSLAYNERLPRMVIEILCDKMDVQTFRPRRSQP